MGQRPFSSSGLSQYDVKIVSDPISLTLFPSIDLLAIRFESLVKINDALRNMLDQGQGEKDLLRHSLMDKPRNVLESELFIILRMSYEAASLSIQAFQT